MMNPMLVVLFLLSTFVLLYKNAIMDKMAVTIEHSCTIHMLHCAFNLHVSLRDTSV